MRSTVKRSARAGIRAAATIRSFLPARQGPRIITYHSVQPNGEGPRSARVQPSDFEAQLTWLAEQGYEVISLSDLVDSLQEGRPLSPKQVSITFDDGYADQYEYAYPVLRRLKMPATIFLVTGKVGCDKKFLTVDQIAEMQENGIEFGAHTVDHVSLSSLPLADARSQIERSKQQLEAITGVPAKHFCYPFGHYNDSVERLVREAGFQSCCTEWAGPVTSASSAMQLFRVGVLGTDTLTDFRLKLAGAYDWWVNLYMSAQEIRRRTRGGN